MESVSFKIYFEKSEGGNEIRRFCIDESSAGTFECVKDKIRQLFPALNNREFNIFWKDNENDKVAVNSDVEYIVAITTIREEVGDEIVRLYVTLANNDAYHASTSTTNENTSPNVIRYTPEQLKSMNAESCDVDDAEDVEPSTTCVSFSPGTLKGLNCGSCDKLLDGKVLFKCVTCPDYDLCAYCVKQSHMEHVMIRIPSQQALMRSGIFVVDRLNRLARRRSHTSRFDFSALVVPVADNYKITHFRKMRDVESVIKTGSTVIPVMGRRAVRKMAKDAAAAAAAAAMMTSHSGAKLKKSASFAEQHQARGEEECGRRGEGCMKRSRSVRVERGNVATNPLQGFQNLFHNVMADEVVQEFRRAPVDNVIKSVADILASVNISCPSDEKTGETSQGSNNQTDTKQPDEGRKRKVSTKCPYSRSVAPDCLSEILIDIFDKGQSAAGKDGDKTTTSNAAASSSSSAAPASQPKSSLDDNDGIRVTAVPEEEGVGVRSSSPSSSSLSSSPEEKGWTFVDPAFTGAIPRRTPVYPSPSDIPVDAVQPPVAPPQGSADPSAPPPTGSAPPPPSSAPANGGQKSERQERLTTALNKMLAMGFTNEGGWLLNLLENHDASIERVLEILLPSSVFGRVID